MIASKQFADDPNGILDSVIDLIDRTIDQVGEIDRNRKGRDSISHPPPSINDPIDNLGATNPRPPLNDSPLGISLPFRGSQPISPMLLSNVDASVRGFAPPGADVSDGASWNPYRSLVYAGSGDSEFGGAAGAGALAAYARLGGSPQTDPRNIRVLSSYPVASDGSRLPPPNPSQTQRQLGRPLGSVTRKPMPDYPVQSPMSGLPDTSVAPGDDNNGRLVFSLD